jgi:hypothetical protein
MCAAIGIAVLNLAHNIYYEQNFANSWHVLTN